MRAEAAKTDSHSLNITVATRLHILEPQWNPAVENQAIGRVVRIGQRKVPTVVRYFVKDSVEKVCYRQRQEFS
jgi:SNF2 family DNA or RNA helicase